MIVRVTWKRAGLAVLALAAAALAFAWSGLFQVSASSGHWKITDWFLHWTMRNSVRTYSTLQTPKAVTTDEPLVSAAGHFRQACAVCHGVPGTSPSPVMQASTPPAPDLARTVGEWSDRELFWIIAHGVKYTGMPAWPADDRPDEIRRMTTFVRRLPGMRPENYRGLTDVAPADEVPSLRSGVLANCTGCHGSDGLGRDQPDIPVLAGQRPGYLLASLRRYAAGERASAPMQVAASQLTGEEMRILAGYFSAMPGLKERPLPQTHPILTEGMPEKQLPACLSCHAPGKGKPLIAGQRASYIEQRLRNWRGDEKVVDARKPHDTMDVIARRIPEEEIGALADALASAGSGDRE